MQRLFYCFRKLFCREYFIGNSHFPFIIQEWQNILFVYLGFYADFNNIFGHIRRMTHLTNFPVVINLIDIYTTYFLFPDTWVCSLFEIQNQVVVVSLKVKTNLSCVCISIYLYLPSVAHLGESSRRLLVTC